jgi:cytochrome c oxidase subunit 2
MSFDPRRNRLTGHDARTRTGARRSAARWRPAVLVSALALVLVPLLAGCTASNPMSTLDPRGPYAAHILNLLTPVFWAAAVVFVLVEGLLVYSVWRWRARPGDALPPQIHGNTRLEITWTIVPAVILLVILGMTFNTQRILSSPPEGGINVRVIGHQWWWEFQYPDLGVTTANELHIPAGQPVHIQLESNDVIHSFWVPKLAGKQDAIPGRINPLWMQADEPGRYEGQCAEFCGIEHALMRLVVIADSPSTFDAWVRNERSIPGFGATPVPPTAGGQASLVTQGAQLFANGACVTCHTIRGTAANAKIGPELTHVGSRTTIAGNVLENTPANLRRWIHNAQAVKPGVVMPSFATMSDADVEAIATYLESLK